MNIETPRLRMFAGPNGSGKTTVKNGLNRPPHWFGVYVNPDDLENELRKNGAIDLETFDLGTSTEEIRAFFSSSAFLRKQSLDAAAKDIECRGTLIDFSRIAMNSYYASVLADFLRRKLLYYIATEDPSINVLRVKNRVADGGHDVPEDKIRERYQRSLGLLLEAIRNSHRAFLFDTSGKESWYFAEATDGVNLELKSSEMPNWFQPIWDQF